MDYRRLEEEAASQEDAIDAMLHEDAIAPRQLWGPEDGGYCPHCGGVSCDGTCGNEGPYY